MRPGPGPHAARLGAAHAPPRSRMARARPNKRGRMLSGPKARGHMCRPVPITIGIALAWAFTSVAILAVRGGVLSGSDGPLAGSDQFLYMDYIRQSGAHLLIGEHFDLTIGHAVYLEPLYLIGGLLWRAGLSVAAAFWALKLLAAPVLALGVCALVVRCIAGSGARLAAILLALFYFSPLVPLLRWTGAVTGLDAFRLDLPSGESMPAWELWGYPHAAVAIGLLALALTGAVLLIGGSRSRRLIAGVTLCAGFAAWIHPWSGAIFLLVVGTLCIRAPARALIPPALAVLAALAYLAILPRVDAGWHTLSGQNGVAIGPLWMFLAALLPLAVPAVWGVRAIPRGTIRTLLVAWPLASLAVFLVSPQFRYHALQGITLPLAVLAVAGCAQVPRARLLGIVALVAAVVAGPAFELTTLRDSLHSGFAPYAFKPDERRALAYLDHVPTPGGVLSRYYLGMAIPAYTGRRTWMGETTWTPDFVKRRAEAELAFDGRASIVSLVSTLRPRFVLSDCGAGPGVRLGARAAGVRPAIWLRRGIYLACSVGRMSSSLTATCRGRVTM